MMPKHLHLAVFSVIVVLFCGGYFIFKYTKQAVDFDKTIQLMPQSEGYAELPAIFSCEPIAPVVDFTFETSHILPEYVDIYDKNNDFAGWITIGDIMSQPVMYSPNIPEFYLTHYIDKTEKKYGTPFIDARCSFNPKSDNIIIHGHNMNDKTVFSPLVEYKKSEFYEAHKEIQFDTLYEKATYVVYAAFVSDFQDDDANGYFNTVDLADESSFDNFISEVSSNSIHKTDVVPQYGDSFITLMTCTNRDDDERMNVIAVKKR